MQTVRIRLGSEQETTRFAQHIAPVLAKGDVIELCGDLGSGKTHFARGIIQHLMAEHGMIEDVPSPTFTLVQTYEIGEMEVWHADLYRLVDPNEALELGLDSAFENAICLIEWPDRLAELAPRNAITVRFTTDSDIEARWLELSTRGAAGDAIIKRAREFG